MDVPDKSGAQWELLRRILFVFLPVLAVLIGFWGDFSPLVYIRQADFKHEQKEPHAMGIGPLTEEEQRLAEMPLTQYIEEVTRNHLIIVQGKAWQDLLSKAGRSFAANQPVPGWESRADGFYLEFNDLYMLYFRPDERPIDEIITRIDPQADNYIRLADSNTVYQIGQIVPSTPTLGAWPTEYPSAMIYPLRKYAWPLVVLGVLAYIFIPRPRKDPRIVEMSRWRLALMDWLAAVMFMMFFGLPFFITAHTQGALSDYIVLTAIFWMLALLGLTLVYWSAWYASYRIWVGNGKIRIFSLKGIEDYNLWDLEYVQPAALRAPRWLIFGTLVGGVAGGSIGTTGQGMILAGSQQNGLYLKAKDGRSAYIWFSSQTGADAMLNFDVLLNELEKAHSPRRDDILDIRAIFPPLH